MVKTALKAWVNAGIEPQSSENISPTRLTNIVAMLVIFVSLLQLPTAFYFWQESGWHETIMSVLTIILLTFVPLLNNLQARKLARALLILVYVSNISISCLLWEININIQYFLLLAVLVCPFLFAQNESFVMGILLVGLCLLFVGIEVWFYLSIIHPPHLFEQQIFKLSYSSLFALSCLLCSFHLWKNINRSWQKLDLEKARSERLLLNILPLSIAQRLKYSSTLIADYFEQASILFADIQDFTPLCKKLSPQQLVGLLNEVFCIFDNLSQKYGLEKIKTSGDGYMAAGGLPTLSPVHAIQCCHCALDMQDAFQIICRKYDLHTGLRIGIGCGEVVAGIIGKNKFSYDLWGEAVNLASRMESQGLCNRIQTTESTYQLTKSKFRFDKRGGIEVKGVGWVTTYWLLGKKNNLETHVLVK
ncbi:adenylate/guanylate cyclase domain-containing protein [Paraglaciecola arctica]|uniref:Adenylate/guanylate cyclase n=1 Tax=Paraglaciecola arctica BSs20135 TaxID=493475 RepID=K6Y241_9ALTE|nr:adenylate/guanylate cyclase domain-containing protein [Paraglaciecola arctica]GAC18006.1 adenylate/guanylate cyclase [Paraglaciecola arctica BSs20135]